MQNVAKVTHLLRAGTVSVDEPALAEFDRALPALIGARVAAEPEAARILAAAEREGLIKAHSGPLFRLATDAKISAFKAGRDEGRGAHRRLCGGGACADWRVVGSRPRR